MICKACGEDCRIVDVDYGIGFFEYMGITGWDSRITRVTSCCEADWIDDDDPQEPDEYITEYDMEGAQE